MKYKAFLANLILLLAMRVLFICWHQGQGQCAVSCRKLVGNGAFLNVPRISDGLCKIAPGFSPLSQVPLGQLNQFFFFHLR